MLPLRWCQGLPSYAKIALKAPKGSYSVVLPYVNIALLWVDILLCALQDIMCKSNNPGWMHMQQEMLVASRRTWRKFMHQFRQVVVPNLLLPPNPENNGSARHVLAMVQPLAVECAPTRKAKSFVNSISTFS